MRGKDLSHKGDLKMKTTTRFTNDEKNFLLKVGYWNEQDKKSFPLLNWKKLAEGRYIPMVCAEDWLIFRRIYKTGNLVKDFEWWLTDAKAKYGIFPSDLEYIKAENITYESAEDYPDTLVRNFIRGMKVA